jgi:ADP-ribosyl-[dinitrogen reductase] hydrolase
MAELILGAIAGEMIGSLHGGKKDDPAGFPLITGTPVISYGTILTVAAMDSLLNGRDYTSTMQVYGKQYLSGNHGTAFARWLRQDMPKPYNSWNNGAALRVSPLGIAARTVSEVIEETRKNALLSHSHPDGIKGAQAVAAAVFMAKNGRTKDEIRDYTGSTFRYNLDKHTSEIRPGYYYDQSCQTSVPEAIIAFLDSDDYESAIRLAVSLGESNGAIPSMTGGIAQAFYKSIPDAITGQVTGTLPVKLYETIVEFSNTYPLRFFR